jgi:hypothetical protein
VALDSWQTAADRARNRLSKLTQHDKIAIALHDFASVEDADVVEFDQQLTE